jgi:hypothetical protein
MIAQPPLIDIYFNVYSYCKANYIFDPIGIGAYHTGIEVKYT